MYTEGLDTKTYFESLMINTYGSKASGGFICIVINYTIFILINLNNIKEIQIEQYFFKQGFKKPKITLDFQNKRFIITLI